MRGSRLAAAMTRIPRPAGPVRPGPRADDHLVALLAPSSFETEQYRALGHALTPSGGGPPRALLAVSGPGVGDGKTTTAINLAATLAGYPGEEVLLVDADLRRPTVARKLDLESSDRPGLAEMILDPAISFDQATCRLDSPALSVLTAGRPPADAFPLIQSARLPEILQQARGRFTRVVVDTPPLLAVPDARVIGQWVDGFIVVIAAHRTPRRLLGEALDSLAKESVIGLVFNADDRPFSGYYGRYRAYARSRAAAPRHSS